MKLQDINVDIFFQDKDKNYEIDIIPENTLSEIIFDYLFSSDRILELNSIRSISSDIIEHYKDSLSNQIVKGAPIHFLLTTFTPKFKLKEYTDSNVYPDMSDLFTLIHLQKVSKRVNEIYPYGFKFFVVFRGDYYKDLDIWSEKEIDQTFDHLKKMNKIAENITGIKNNIKLIRWDYFSKDYPELFEEEVQSRADRYYGYWKAKMFPHYEQIENWKKDFGELLFTSVSDPSFEERLTKVSCKIKALNQLLFRRGELLEIIKEKHPNLLIANTNGETRFFSIDLNLKFRKPSHFSLTIFKDGNWDYETWVNIKSSKKFKPIYFEEFNHPLYFEWQKE